MSQFTIKDKDTLKDKLDMVQSLGEIEIATRLIEDKGKQGMAEVDSNYEKLHCTITALEQNVWNRS
jgi:poly [ADP-ribose] polymerase